jgi:iron complex outermembrane receptor protein
MIQMKHWLLLLTIGLISLTAQAQERVLSGKITDGETKEPMIGASVVVKGSSTGAVTDLEGAFQISVPADAKVLQVSYIGYNTREIPIGKSDVINVVLESSIVSGKEVVVSGSRVSEALKQSSVKIEKMNAREIKNAASGDFYQNMGYYKGIDIVTSSAGLKTVNLRGFGDTRSLRTKQYIDYVDNESPGLNIPLGNLIGANDLDLQSVEIVSGPSSALYGANAMQGIIAMNTKSPYDYQGISFQIKGGATTQPSPMVDAQFRWAQTFGKDKRFAVKVTGSYFFMEDWEAKDDSFNRYGAIETDQNVTFILREKANQPVGPDFTQEDKDKLIKLTTGWLDFNPIANPNVIKVKAPGYMERELADYNTKSLKAQASLHYRFKNEMELIGSFKYGYGSAVYQATARYQIKDFMFYQPKIELKGKNFFVRSYASLEDAGRSYNIGLTGSYTSRAAVPDYISGWVDKYFDVLDTLTNGFCEDCTERWMVDSARNSAFRHAQQSWYRGGSQQFNDTFNNIIRETNSLTGTRFYDRSLMSHTEGQYRFDMLKAVDLIAGASFRMYLPNSRGTILEDTVGNKISMWEVGAYLQASKSILQDKLKFSLALRVDKNKNFAAQFSPRGSIVYNINKDHLIRVSAAYAFRNPTLQDLYLYLDIGRIFLAGNLRGVDNVYTLQSVQDFNNYFDSTFDYNTSLLKSVKIAPLKPEKVISAEIGYRGEIAKRVLIDFTGYFARYTDFIGFARLVRPQLGTAGTESGINDVLVGNTRLLQFWLNSPKPVPTWGAELSVSYYIGKGITPYVNYTYADLDDSNLKNSDQGNVLSGFNTPRHKVNVGVNAYRVWKGLGFSANFKWVPSFEWQAPMGDGTIPSYHYLDLQVSYEVEKWYSSFRIGGSNVYNNPRFEAIAGPTLGALYYAGMTFDFNKLGQKKAAAAK